MTLPTIALTMFGGPEGWRYARWSWGCMACSTGSPSPTGPPQTPTRSPQGRSAGSLNYRDLIMLSVMTVPMVGILGVLVWRVQRTGYIDDITAWACYLAIAVVILYAGAGVPCEPI